MSISWASSRIACNKTSASIINNMNIYDLRGMQLLELGELNRFWMSGMVFGASRDCDMFEGSEKTTVFLHEKLLGVAFN
jgi:hypothetical protein